VPFQRRIHSLGWASANLLDPDPPILIRRSRSSDLDPPILIRRF
jgi:hypothetical protein